MYRKDIPDEPCEPIKRKRKKKDRKFCQKTKGEHTTTLVVSDRGFCWGKTVQIVCIACGYKVWHLWSDQEIEDYKAREHNQ